MAACFLLAAAAAAVSVCVYVYACVRQEVALWGRCLPLSLVVVRDGQNNVEDLVTVLPSGYDERPTGG